MKSTTASESVGEPLVRALVEEVGEHHASTVKSLLTTTQKALDQRWTISSAAKSRATSGGSQLNNPTSYVEASSPFVGLNASHKVKRKYQDAQLDFLVEVNSKQYRQSCHTKLIEYESQDNVVPGYQNYISIRNNVLSENNEVLRYLPYFGEDEEENPDSLWEQYQNGWKTQAVTNWIEEGCKSLTTVLNKLAEYSSCSIDDILRYLIELGSSPISGSRYAPSGRRPIWDYDRTMVKGFDLNDAQRRQLLSILPQRSSQPKRIIDNLCSVFSATTGLDVWNVLTHEPRIAALLKESTVLWNESTQTGANSRYTKLAAYTRLRCSICYM